MDKKFIIKQFLLGFIIYFSLSFLFKYGVDKESLSDSLLYAGTQSLIFSIIFTAILSFTNKQKK